MSQEELRTEEEIMTENTDGSTAEDLSDQPAGDQAETAEPENAADSESAADSENTEETEAAESSEAAEGSDNQEEADKTDESDDMGFLGRKAKKALLKKDQELQDLNDRYKRILAEYDNFRKRTEKEKSDLYAYAVRDVMTRILPVVDNLERGVAAVPEEQRQDPLAEGMEKILKQFEKTLEDIGVKPIESVGQPFDPAYHNAVMHVEDEELGENTVVEEFMKGYMYKDTVIRCAMVKVAN